MIFPVILAIAIIIALVYFRDERINKSVERYRNNGK